MRVLVAGVGAVGTRAARQLVDTPGVVEVLLADTDGDRMAKVVDARSTFHDKNTKSSELTRSPMKFSMLLTIPAADAIHHRHTPANNSTTSPVR